MSCSNGTHASPQFSSFLLQWRQPRPRNRSISKGEERQPRAPPPQLPRLTQRLPRTQRPRRERPHGCRTAEQRDEIAPAAHSITSSVRASSEIGGSRPSALAVLRLI